MRLSKEITNFLKSEILKLLPNSDSYLFGSRVDNQKKGGDIDILVIGDRKLSFSEKTKIKIAFYKKFGGQKIDIISYTKKEKNNFKSLILQEAIKL